MSSDNTGARDWASVADSEMLESSDVPMLDSSTLPDVPGSNSYANVVRRSRRNRTFSVSSDVSHVSVDSRGTSSSFADFGEFADNNDRMTNFEREHWHANNILPSRTCSAFFRPPDKSISSTDVFKSLNSIGIPVTAVRCLQRNPSGHAFLTFSTSDYCKRFLQKSPWIPRRNNTGSSLPSAVGVTYVTIYDAPFELSDQALEYRLSPFGSVVSKRRSRVPGYSNVLGHRVFGMKLNQSIPSFLRFGRFVVRVWHPGQTSTCRKCNRPGHVARDCENVIGFNCEELGHVSRECPEPVVCSICRDTGHVANRCRLSWYVRPRDGPTADDSVPDAPPPSSDAATPPSTDPPSTSDVAPAPIIVDVPPPAPAASAPAVLTSTVSTPAASTPAISTSSAVDPQVPSAAPAPSDASQSFPAVPVSQPADPAPPPVPSRAPDDISDSAIAAVASPSDADNDVPSSPALLDSPSILDSSPTVSDVIMAELVTPSSPFHRRRSSSLTSLPLSTAISPRSAAAASALRKIMPCLGRKPAKLSAGLSPPSRKTTNPYPVTNPKKKALNPP